VTNSVLLDRKGKTQQYKKIKHKNACAAGNLTRDLSESGCITSAPPSQLRVSIVVELYNCFDAMGRKRK